MHQASTEGRISENRPHRGITTHQLQVGGGFPGLVFAVGSVLIFVLGVPALGYVLGGGLVLGLVVAAILQVAHR